jgi:hypothetical protein
LLADWKKSGVQIVYLIISSGLIGTGLITFLTNSYYKPNINIEVSQNGTGSATTDNNSIFPGIQIATSTTTYRITNGGNLPATHIVVTIRAAQNITKPYNHVQTIFSTENYTKPIKLDPRTIQFTVSRLVSGNASFVEVTTNSPKNMLYTIYATYDQGSTQFNQKSPDFFTFLQKNAASLLSILAGISVLVILKRRTLLKKRVVIDKPKGKKTYLTSSYSLLGVLKRRPKNLSPSEFRIELFLIANNIRNSPYSHDDFPIVSSD